MLLSNPMTRALFLIAALAAAGAAGAQTIYRWTDAQGKTHYTSDPPPGTSRNVVRPRVNSYAAPAAAGTPAAETPAAAPRPAAAPAGPVIMYATSWCPYCAKARAYFSRNGIAYTEYDIEKSATANAEFKRLGGRGVPLILVGRERVEGFNELAFEFAWQKATY